MRINHTHLNAISFDFDLLRRVIRVADEFFTIRILNCDLITYLKVKEQIQIV